MKVQEEIKSCQNCKQEFRIEPEDFAFYEKINVPPPTWCPECRYIRRAAFWDMFKLYKRKCDLCGNMLVSRYAPGKPYRVYCVKCWWSDTWDGLQYGRDYDFSRPFFEQFDDLLHEAPLLGLSLEGETTTTSPYANHAGDLSQCYLLFNSAYDENSAYGYYLIRSKDCYDVSMSASCERLSDSFHVFKSYGGKHLYYTLNSSHSAFLWQCNNCQDCFLSANLRGKQHYILNKPYTKEEYDRKMKEYDLGSYRIYEVLKKEAHEHWLKFPVKTTWHEFSQNVTGIFVFQSRNTLDCFEVVGAENCRYCHFLDTGPLRECYDITSFGDGLEQCYEGVVIGYQSNRMFFSDESGISGHNVCYSKSCISNVSNLFGCVSVRNKSHCILNKQYSREAYEELVPKIIQHMNEKPYRDKQGREYPFGEFFPPALSSFAYNETLAQLDYPLKKEEALAWGFSWRDEEQSEHPVTVAARDLPDHIKDASDSILQETIGCGSCGRAFRLIPQELAFYREMNVPLPRKCFFCRLDDHMKYQPHPIRRWKRQCQCTGDGSENGIYKNAGAHFHKGDPCPNSFEASYAPDRPEIVYCEQCYQAEVA